MKKPKRPTSSVLAASTSSSSFRRHDSTCIFWSNLAFISDENDDHDDHFSSVGSNTLLASPKDDQCENIRKYYFNMNAAEEEVTIREELAAEIVKELERELMDGILVLVRRLSHLKGTQIARRLKNLDLDMLSLGNFLL